MACPPLLPRTRGSWGATSVAHCARPLLSTGHVTIFGARAAEKRTRACFAALRNGGLEGYPVWAAPAPGETDASALIHGARPSMMVFVDCNEAWLRWAYSSSSR